MKFNLEKNEKSCVKLKQILKKLKQNTIFYVKHSQFTTKDGIVNLQPTRSTHGSHKKMKKK